MIRKLFYFFCLAALYSMCSCTDHIYSNLAKGVNFKQYKTYALIPDADTTHNGNRINDEIIRRGLTQDVSDEMTLRGFKLDTAHPDLLVLVHAVITRKDDTVRVPIYSSYPYYYTGVYIGPWYPWYYSGYYTIPDVVGYNMQKVTYVDGSIVIDVIERSSRKLIWRGWTEENEFDPGMLTNQIRHKITRIFDAFPVQARYE
jgi:hypothetical protein